MAAVTVPTHRYKRVTVNPPSIYRLLHFKHSSATTRYAPDYAGNNAAFEPRLHAMLHSKTRYSPPLLEGSSLPIFAMVDSLDPFLDTTTMDFEGTAYIGLLTTTEHMLFEKQSRKHLTASDTTSSLASTSSADSSSSTDDHIRVETKKVFVRTYKDCNTRFSRKPELQRHFKGTHKREYLYLCRTFGCYRSVRGFPRREKRHDHEKSMHGATRA